MVWLVLIFTGTIAASTSYDKTGTLLWHQICIEYPGGSTCLNVPKGVMNAFVALGTRHWTTTVTFIDESVNPFFQEQ